MTTMFQKILIANRGEIACRIIRTARRLGIQTVAIYSQAEPRARHVRLADAAYEVGAAEAQDSYLNGDKIIAVALKSGAQAIHPGYGFLSENADFAQKCRDAGIVFIGPDPAAIQAMGDKHIAKELMDRHGVPTIPGFSTDGLGADVIATKAHAIGYPLLIKPVAGGGGKGMQRVDAPENLADALTSATRSALAAFGNGGLLIEKYLQNPRHIEVQVFGDALGNCVHLFERDCTLQRRHQKVVEEAPAFGLTEEERHHIGAIAVKAARSVSYQGAGTVEFLRDQGGQFYFIEMNTRLQVEHPVTEMITGLDLVEWQLRVAAGEALPLTQDRITHQGHAVEVRWYAEDPLAGFLPATGTITGLETPATCGGVRLDTGVETGDAITRFYDPMIAKIIVHAPSRSQALLKLARVLGDCYLAGVETNGGFLRRLITHPQVLAGNFDTGFIEHHLEDLLNPPVTDGDRVFALAKVLADRVSMGDDPWCALPYWRMNGPCGESIPLDDGAIKIEHGTKNSFYYQGHWAHFQVDGSFMTCQWNGETHRRAVGRSGPKITVYGPQGTVVFTHINPIAATQGIEEHQGSLSSPMPGKVIAVHVRNGDQVTQGTPLIIIEAMKMEHTIKAPRDGTIESLTCQPGDIIDEGVDMLKITLDRAAS